MSPRTKQQLEVIREEKAQIIAESALKLFATKGYENTSISELARHAGVSKGLIYNYFDSKEAILKSIVNHVIDTMWDRFGFKDMTQMTDEDYLRFINLSLDLVLDDLDHWRLYFGIFTQPSVLSMLMEEMMVKSGPYLKIMHDYYVEKGYENPAVQMRYVSAIIDGIQMHIMLDPENFPIEEVRKLLIQQLTQKT